MARCVHELLAFVGRLHRPSLATAREDQGSIPMGALSFFMKHITDELMNAVELMLAFLCGRHAQPVAGFQFHVCTLPEDKRSNRHVRFGYALFDGENVIPASYTHHYLVRGR